MAKKPIIRIKRGDDFKLDLTVTDTNNSTAIGTKEVLDAAQVTYDELLQADPQDPQAITDALDILNTSIAAYNDAITVNISDWVITSQMAWCGRVIDEFVVSMADALTGTFTISRSREFTKDWIPRKYDTDIQFIRPQGKVSSQTYTIEVMKDITDG